MIQFSLVTDEEEDDSNSKEYWVAESWQAWEIECCVERHNGHQWELECIVDEEGLPELYCKHCPVTLDDIFVTDSHDLMYGELGEVKIEGGIHNSKVDIIIPVNVETHAEKYYSMAYIYPEWDLWVELTLR